MQVDAWLKVAQQKLLDAGITTPRLDVLVLLEDCLGRDRAWLLAHSETELTGEHQAKLTKQLKRRGGHEPLAYIRGKAEFYGRTFIVNKNVLVPRPESETMIELLKKVAPPNAAIADIGTGSGALAITAALELPEASVAAVDIDQACLDIAERNAVSYDTNLQLFKGNLLEPFLQENPIFKPSVLLCNLPYVPDEYAINKAATHEPALALFAGADGLDLYRILFTQAETLKPKFILTEALPEQHAELAKIAAASSYKLHASDDFIQVFIAAE